MRGGVRGVRTARVAGRKHRAGAAAADSAARAAPHRLWQQLQLARHRQEHERKLACTGWGEGGLEHRANLASSAGDRARPAGKGAAHAARRSQRPRPPVCAIVSPAAQLVRAGTPSNCATPAASAAFTPMSTSVPAASTSACFARKAGDMIRPARRGVGCVEWACVRVCLCGEGAGGAGGGRTGRGAGRCQARTYASDKQRGQHVAD